jgi:predicted nucleic-acid-binding protein
MIALDTNVLVRYFAQDDVRQAALATELIEQQLSATHKGFVSLVALLETVWVMESCYDADAATVSDILADLLDTDSIEVQEAPAVRRAFELSSELGKPGQLDLHDCLIATLAQARQAPVFTFDAKAAKRLGMTLLR